MTPRREPENHRILCRSSVGPVQAAVTCFTSPHIAGHRLRVYVPTAVWTSPFCSAYRYSVTKSGQPRTQSQSNITSVTLHCQGSKFTWPVRLVFTPYTTTQRKPFVTSCWITKENLELSFCTSWRHLGGFGDVAPLALNLGCRWKWVAGFTPGERLPGTDRIRYNWIIIHS